MIWIYAKAKQMYDHNFTDAVAICFALTRKSAMRKFHRIYLVVNDEDVRSIPLLYFMLWRHPLVLTDY